MGGDGGKQARSRADEERQRGQELSRQAVGATAVSPMQQQSIERGFGLESQLSEFALDPQRFIQQAQPGMQGLVESLTQRALENVVTPTFQKRGLSSSGLAVEGGTRAATEQAIGVSSLVLQRAQQNAALLRGVTGDVLGRGQAATGMAQQGALQGLQFQQTAQGRGVGIEEAGIDRAREDRAALGSLAGRGLGAGASLLLAGPTGGASLLALPGLLAGQSSAGLQTGGLSNIATGQKTNFQMPQVPQFPQYGINAQSMAGKNPFGY